MSQLSVDEESVKSQRSKIIGFSISLMAVCVVLLAGWLLLGAFGLLVVVPVEAAVVALCIPAFIVGYKLLRYPSEIRVSVETVRGRVEGGKFEPKIDRYPGIVYFCGIDGTGKTTQIKLVENDLASNKIRLGYVHLRYAAFLSLPFFGFCRIFGFTKWGINEHGTRVSEYQFYRNRALARLYSWLFTFDMYLRASLTTRLLLWRGNLVLCDRCSIDGLVDLMADTRDFDLWQKRAGRLLLSLVSHHSLVVLFDLDERVAFARKKDLTNLEFLSVRRRLYLDFAPRLNMKVVDAQGSPTELHSRIEAVLAEKPFWYFGRKNA